MGTSRFLRNDAESLFSYPILGGLGDRDFSFLVKPWHSPSLASDLGRSGNTIVVDEIALSSPDAPSQWPISRSNVAMEAFNVHEIVRTSENPEPTANRETWETAYGLEPGEFDHTWRVAAPPIPGSWVAAFGDDINPQIDIQFDPPISTAESAQLIGSMLTEAGYEFWTSYHRPTPSAPLGLRLNGFVLGLKGAPHLVGQLIDGDEETGVVTRVMMMVINTWSR